MISSKCTLWMGNIENWMSHTYLEDLLKAANIFPNKITIKNYQNKRGCAFLEFNTPEMAKYVLSEYNNKIINGVELKFNKVHSFEQKYSTPKIIKFTVRIFYNFNNLMNSYLLEILINQYLLKKSKITFVLSILLL